MATNYEQIGKVVDLFIVLFVDHEIEVVAQMSTLSLNRFLMLKIG